MIKNVQFEDVYLLLSAGVVSCRYLHVTWKYKTYRNPVYCFTMYTWSYSAGIVLY